jgi:hypothetical protein
MGKTMFTMTRWYKGALNYRTLHYLMTSPLWARVAAVSCFTVLPYLYNRAGSEAEPWHIEAREQFLRGRIQNDSPVHPRVAGESKHLEQSLHTEALEIHSAMVFGKTSFVNSKQSADCLTNTMDQNNIDLQLDGTPVIAGAREVAIAKYVPISDRSTTQNAINQGLANSRAAIYAYSQDYMAEKASTDRIKNYFFPPKEEVKEEVKDLKTAWTEMSEDDKKMFTTEAVKLMEEDGLADYLADYLADGIDTEDLEKIKDKVMKDKVMKDVGLSKENENVLMDMLKMVLPQTKSQ